MKRKGFSLIELMVVVAIIAILAAIALPMYSVFRKKAKASGAINSCKEAKPSLQIHYEDAGSFTGVVIGATGKLESATGANLGVGMPDQVENDTVNWTLGVTADTATFTWTFTNCADCAGTFCFTCTDANGSCESGVSMVHADLQTLNKGLPCT